MNENTIVAITKLNEIVTDIDKDDTCFLDIKDTVEEVIALLKAKDTNVPTKWISVKDRLPEIDEDVLILYESKVSRKTGYAITFLKDSFYFGSTPIPYETPQWNEPWQYFSENNSITHWMPLPEPPKEGENE